MFKLVYFLVMVCRFETQEYGSLKSKELISDLLHRLNMSIFLSQEKLTPMKQSLITDYHQINFYPESYSINNKDILVNELSKMDFFPDAWYQRPDRFFFEFFPKNLNTYIKGDHLFHEVYNGIKSYYDLNILFYNEPSDLLLQNHASLIYRYLLCYLRIDVYRNCPSPCNLNPCKKIKHSTGVCYSIQDLTLDVILLNNSVRFKSIFQKGFKCSCDSFYRWNSNSKQCSILNKFCSNEVLHCYNGGTCIINENKVSI